MKRKIVAFSLVVGLIAVIAGSCENDSENNRAVVIVSSINAERPVLQRCPRTGGHGSRGRIVLHGR